MNKSVNASYKESLEQLIELTANGRVAWERQNPSTYFYTSGAGGEDKFVTSIQHVPLGRGHVLEIVNTDTNEKVLRLNTANEIMGNNFGIGLVTGLGALTPTNPYDDRQYFGDLLAQLFNEVDQAVGMKSANVFQGIVKSISKE